MKRRERPPPPPVATSVLVQYYIPRMSRTRIPLRQSVLVLNNKLPRPIQHGACSLQLEYIASQRRLAHAPLPPAASASSHSKARPDRNWQRMCFGSKSGPWHYYHSLFFIALSPRACHCLRRLLSALSQPVRSNPRFASPPHAAPCQYPRNLSVRCLAAACWQLPSTKIQHYLG